MFQQLRALRRPFQIMVAMQIGLCLLYLTTILQMYFLFGTLFPTVEEMYRLPSETITLVNRTSQFLSWIFCIAVFIGKIFAYWRFSHTSDELIPTWNIFGRGCWWLLWIGVIFTQGILPIFTLFRASQIGNICLSWGTWIGAILATLTPLCLYIFTWQIASVLKSRVAMGWLALAIGLLVVPKFVSLSSIILSILTNVFCGKTADLEVLVKLSLMIAPYACSLGAFLTILMGIKRVERENGVVASVDGVNG